MPWALITGACSGIGLEIAREAARHGYSLVIVSNRTTELQEAAVMLAACHDATVHTVTMDLARPNAAADLYARITDLGVDIDMLVNNAGMLLFGELVNMDPAQIDALLQLHVTTPSLLARYFGADMKVRRHGNIVFMSSASTWCDFPGIALYGSTKRYLRSFAASLREELAPWGVHVTCVAPGAVATDLYGASNQAAAKASRLGLLGSPTAVARSVLKGSLRGKALILPGPGAKLMALAARLTPRWLVHVVRARTHLLPHPHTHDSGDEG